MFIFKKDIVTKCLQKFSNFLYAFKIQQNNQNLQPTIQTTVAWQPQAQLEAIARNVQQQAQSTPIDKKTPTGFNSSRINNAGGSSCRNIHSKPCIGEWDIPKTANINSFKRKPAFSSTVLKNCFFNEHIFKRKHSLIKIDSLRIEFSFENYNEK